MLARPLGFRSEFLKEKLPVRLRSDCVFLMDGLLSLDESSMVSVDKEKGFYRMGCR